jgi:hypothetical protein
MEATGGEPDVIFYDNNTDEYIFIDCSAESPKGRRNICYDREALEGRKESKPYKIKPLNYLRSVKQEFIQNLGVIKGASIFYKVILWDFLFKKPQWAPEKFNLTSKRQEMFFGSKEVKRQ